VTLDLGAAAVADPLRSNTPSSGMDKGIGIEPACLEESSKPRRNKGLKRGVETLLHYKVYDIVRQQS